MGIEVIVIVWLAYMAKNGAVDLASVMRGKPAPSMEKFKAREARRDRAEAKPKKERGPLGQWLDAVKDIAAREAVEHHKHNHQRRLAWYAETAPERDEAWRAKQRRKLDQRKASQDRFAGERGVVEGTSTSADQPSTPAPAGTATPPAPGAPAAATPTPTDAKGAAPAGGQPSKNAGKCERCEYDWTPETSLNGKDFGYWKCRACGHTMTAAEMNAAKSAGSKSEEKPPATGSAATSSPASGTPAPSGTDSTWVRCTRAVVRDGHTVRCTVKYREKRDARGQVINLDCGQHDDKPVISSTDPAPPAAAATPPAATPVAEPPSPGRRWAFCTRSVVRDGVTGSCGARIPETFDDQGKWITNRDCGQHDNQPAATTGPAATPAPQGGSMYEQGAARLAAAAGAIDTFRANLAQFRSAMDGRKWGTGVTGPIGECDGELAAVAAAYRELAEQIKHQGDKVKDAYDQHPDVPREAALA